MAGSLHLQTHHGNTKHPPDTQGTKLYKKTDQSCRHIVWTPHEVGRRPYAGAHTKTTIASLMTTEQLSHHNELASHANHTPGDHTSKFQHTLPNTTDSVNKIFCQHGPEDLTTSLPSDNTMDFNRHKTPFPSCLFYVYTAIN